MTSPVYRPWIIYVVGVVLLLGEIIFIGYGTGWPATPDSCLTIPGGDCYCEWFDPELVKAGARGFRQPVNTWSNLYALFTAAWVACRMMRDRKEGTNLNVMRSNSPIADACVFVVLVPRSRQHVVHASMSSAASWMDGFSMYIFAGYLVFYTIDRLLVMKGVSEATRNLIFWVGWPINAVIYTDIAATHLPSEVLIGILVTVYIGSRACHRLVGQGRLLGRLARMEGRARASLLAVRPWRVHHCHHLPRARGRRRSALLQQGGYLVQPHGLIWHTFSGAMAILIYFYWRRENVPKPQPTQ